MMHGVVILLAAAAFGADRPLGNRPSNPPANPPAGSTPGTLIPPAPNPVPGGGTGPIVTPTPVPLPTVPPDPVPGPPQQPGPGPVTPCPEKPVVVCPGSQVIIWPWGSEFTGVGINWVTNVPWGHRQGVPGEALRDTSRRLDPGLLPVAPEAVVLTPQQSVIADLTAERYERAVETLKLMAARPVGVATPSGGAAVPPGSAPAAAERSWTGGETLRYLSVALVGLKRSNEAVRALDDAYRAEPELASRPISAASVGGDAALRNLVLRAVTHAQRVNTPDAWLVVAVLMQAQDRRELPPAVVAGLKNHPLRAKFVTTP